MAEIKCPLAGSGSHRDLVDFVRRVTGTFVDALHGLGVGSLGETEHVSGGRVEGDCVDERAANVDADEKTGKVSGVEFIRMALGGAQEKRESRRRAHGKQARGTQGLGAHQRRIT